MTTGRPLRTHVHRSRIRWRRVAALSVVVAALAVAVVQGLPTSPSTTGSSSGRAASPGEIPAGAPRDALGRAGGAVPDGTTVFDEGVPGVANLDPDLLAALRRAATDAGYDGVTFVVDSGWRSPEYQQRLLDEAVAKYGSREEAARWVATPRTSAHVSGDAIDIGPAAARDWLSVRGAAYGLCRTYANEPWHVELRPAATDDGCPAMYADPTQDPRMAR